MITDNLGFLLHDSARLLRRSFERRVVAYGLSSAQWRLLAHVLRHGAIAQARLADALEIEAISVSRLVDRMEHAGWVERHPAAGDRRIKMISASPRALAVQAELKSIARAVYAEALADLAPQAQSDLLTALAQVTVTLSASLAPPSKDV